MKTLIPLLGLTFLSGCCPAPKGHAQAEYVRNPVHHCKFDNRFEGSKYIGDDGVARRSWSWNSYSCDNDVHVIIDDEGEQP